MAAGADFLKLKADREAVKRTVRQMCGERRSESHESREEASLRVDSTPFARGPRVESLKRQAVTR